MCASPVRHPVRHRAAGVPEGGGAPWQLGGGGLGRTQHGGRERGPGGARAVRLLALGRAALEHCRAQLRHRIRREDHAGASRVVPLRTCVAGCMRTAAHCSTTLHAARAAHAWRMPAYGVPIAPCPLLQAKREAGDDLVHLDMREAASLGRLVAGCTEASNLEISAWPDAATAAGAGAPGGRALPRRLYLVAKHDIPPLTEFTWDHANALKRRASERATDKGAGGAVGDAVLAAALTAKRARIERATNPRTVGAQVEVLQPDKGGLAGARYAAQVLAAGRGDGMVQLQY
eukprot:scaffold98514_cov75-Phaeocystis_antarctica.AAC.2